MKDTKKIQMVISDLKSIKRTVKELEKSIIIRNVEYKEYLEWVLGKIENADLDIESEIKQKIKELKKVKW